MNNWTEINVAITFHEKDNISIYKCFKEVVDDHYGLECCFRLQNLIQNGMTRLHLIFELRLTVMWVLLMIFSIWLQQRFMQRILRNSRWICVFGQGY